MKKQKKNILRIKGKVYTFSPKKLLLNIAKLILFCSVYLIIFWGLLNAPKSPTEQWHEAIDSGISWSEYISQ